MTRARLPLSRIAVVDRLRPVDDAWAEAIMVSLSERGLDTPIKVRPASAADGADHLLVAGLHRLEAARRLGWDEIDVDIVAMDDDEARLAEIDENLMRRELSVLDRAIFMRERKLVWDRLHPETAKPGPKAKRMGELSQPLRQLPRFTEEAAERTGFSERWVQLAISIGRLPQEVRDIIRGTPMEGKTRQLVALVPEEPEDQIAIARLLVAGEVKSVSEAKLSLGLVDPPAVPVATDPTEPGFRKLMAAWLAADDATKDRFVRVLRKNGEL